MEGTHCTLQLRKPITELCYISFYLPRGEVRGFSYKGTVTLDKSNKGFQICYQVREGSDIISLSQQPNEHPGDIFFKQTPTKDILTELYKLTAERERLLANLLSSDNILGITMGNQEGNLRELSMSLAVEGDYFQSADGCQAKPPVGSLNKRSAHRSRKPQRFGRRRGSCEALLQKRTRRKERGDQESALQVGKDQISSSKSLPPSQARPNLRFLEERGNLPPNGALRTSLQRRESCPLEIPRSLDADPGFGRFGTASEGTGLGRGVLPPGCSSTEAGNDGVQGPQRRAQRLEHQQAHLSGSHVDPEKQTSKRGQREKPFEQTCRKKPVSNVVAEVQDLSTQVQRAVKAHPQGEERMAICPEDPAEFIPKADLPTILGAEAEAQCSSCQDKAQQGDRSLQSLARERASISSVPASAEGAVNKILLKVIESEKVDEATEGKRLGFPLSRKAPHTLPERRSSRKAGLPLSGHKTLFLDLPHSAGLDSSQPRGDEKRLYPPELAAVDVIFNNSSSQSDSYKRMSPVPPPLSLRLPSPQQHHRILRVPPLPGEREAALNDCPGRESGTFSGSPSADILEPPSSAKVTETKGTGSASLRAGQPWLVPREALEKSLGAEKTTAWSQHQSPPGSPPFGTMGGCYYYNPRLGRSISVPKIWKCRHRRLASGSTAHQLNGWEKHRLSKWSQGFSSEGFPRDCHSEQTATKDLPSRDGGVWVLGYRAGPSCPFLLHEEREKPNRSELFLDLPPDQSPTEQDDRTPGRLQAVWPPPKTKDTEEKVGLKYTEAENNPVKSGNLTN
ncbi:formin-1 isoform X8 [Tamandua tetradactyla]|uniref:formin-1 isoform X8 n=1 Tax=Tamandua tetradactyla TaxID=48850 RepID=UPI00405443B0